MIQSEPYKSESETAYYYNKNGQKVVSATLDTPEVLRLESMRLRRGCSMAALVREALAKLKD